MNVILHLGVEVPAFSPLSLTPRGKGWSQESRDPSTQGGNRKVGIRPSLGSIESLRPTDMAPGSVPPWH